MPTIKTDQFAGIVPRMAPTLLPDSAALIAHNCRLKSGKVEPVLMPQIATGFRMVLENGLTKISDAKSIYIWRRGTVTDFLAWPGIVKVAPSNIADDERYRLFVTGETGYNGANEPLVYIADSDFSTVRHPLIKVAPVAPTVETIVHDSTENIRYTYFFQSFVDAYGYESPTSLPSKEVAYLDGDVVTIGEVQAPDWAVTRRIYKVITGTESERIQYINEEAKVNVTFPTHSFRLSDDDAGEVMPHIVSAPDDLTWMTNVPNGFYAGLRTGNLRKVCFSEIDRPYSWPPDYEYPIKDDAVGLAVAGNNVYVLTNGYPWVISGSAPESMSVSSLASPQACVSPYSVCVMNGSVFYASRDGVCMLNSDSLNAPVITAGHFSKKEWDALNPETCIMDSYDGALFAWFLLDSGVRQGYIIDIAEGVSAIRTHDEQAKAVLYDTQSDSLYFIRDREVST